MADAERLRFLASNASGEVSALLLAPPDALAVYVFAHGAGAGMDHAFMRALAERLADQRIATMRYQFPYRERGSRRPDPPRIAIATVRAAVRTARARCGELPIFAGGKSFGGRMTSLAAADAALDAVRGLAFVGFPLHAAGKPAVARAEHLSAIGIPMLFLQGTRDKLAELDRLRPVCEKLGARARLVIIDGADHSFHVLKRSGRNDGEVLAQLAREMRNWMESLC